MEYDILIIKNKKRYKKIGTFRTSEGANNKYNKILEQNKVLYPQQYGIFIKKKIVRVDYEIVMMKDYEEGDELITVRDNYGQLLTKENKIQPNGKIIVKRDVYSVEERFTIMGIKQRYTTAEIIKNLLLMKKEDFMKRITFVHNKLVVEHSNTFDVVICKNRNDAERLHHTLEMFCKVNKLGGVIFFGLADMYTAEEFYTKIHEKTGWVMDRIFKTSTRY
mgnify:CR=1 FL=1